MEIEYLASVLQLTVLLQCLLDLSLVDWHQSCQWVVKIRHLTELVARFAGMFPTSI